MKKTILNIAFILMSVWASGQTSAIIGKVKTADGAAGEMVNVSIKGTTRGSAADKNGHFEIRKLEAGTYTLVASFVGLETKETVIELKGGETKEEDFVMNENSEQLQEIVISTSANKYQKQTPSSSLRLNAPLIEIPQNIQIVTNETLKDQQVISMSDGLIRNVSGAIRMEHWGDLYTNITARGSQIQAFRNGFNVVNSYWGPLTEDMSFVDRVEFVKGPAGFMLANGDPSGLYNVVTKKPTGENKGEATLTMGSFELFRAALDLDGKLSKNGKVLYRLNLSAQNKKSHRANEFNNRYVIAPVISYQIDNKTKLILEYNYQHAKMSDVGSFYVFGTEGFATLPRNFTSLPAGMPATNIHDHSFYANLEHRFNGHWKITSQLGRFVYNQQGSSMWPSSVDSLGNMIRSTSSWDAKSLMSMGQVFVNGEANTGSVGHRILAGIDIADKEYFADWGQSHSLDSSGAEFNVYNPNYGTPVNGYANFDYATPIEGRANAIGGLMDQKYSTAYLQDELGFFKNKIRLTLAARYSNVSQSDWGGPAKTAERITPRLGISASLNHNTSFYALYDQAFIPQNGKLANGNKVEPITGENTEIGIKRNWFGGNWSSNISIYRIIKNNELVADPMSPPASGLSVELGQKISEGFEVDLRGRIAKGLNLIANYTYTDSRVSKVAENITDMKVGDIVPGFARHTANIWLSYSIQQGFAKGLGVNAGLIFIAGRNTYWDPSPNNEYALPTYMKIDAGLFWEKDKIRINANIFNVMNEYLYSGSYYKWLSAYYWQTEPGRNFRLSIGYKF